MLTFLCVIVLFMKTERTQSSGVLVCHLANHSESLLSHHIVEIILPRMLAIDVRTDLHITAVVCLSQDGPKVNVVVGNGPVRRKPCTTGYPPGQIKRKPAIVSALVATVETTWLDCKSRQFEPEQSPQGLALLFQEYCSYCQYSV